MTTNIQLIGKTRRTILRKVRHNNVVRTEITYPDGSSEAIFRKSPEGLAVMTQTFKF